MFKTVIKLLTNERRAHALLITLSNKIIPVYFSLGLDRVAHRFEHIFSVGGFRMVARLTLSDLLIVLTDFEPYVRAIFNPEEGQTVLDIGAHIGFYTLMAARQVGSTGKVIAVECDPSNFNMLKRNVDMNNFKNVITVNSALSDVDGYVKMYLAWDSALTTGDAKRHKQKHVRACVSLRSMKVDTLLNQLGIHYVNWMKIDVEGMEMQVLRGAARTLLQSPCIKIIIEISQENLREVLEYLQGFGFSVSCLFFNPPLPGYYYAKKGN
jgi:FkbM family methyltransferase